MPGDLPRSGAGGLLSPFCSNMARRFLTALMAAVLGRAPGVHKKINRVKAVPAVAEVATAWLKGLPGLGGKRSEGRVEAGRVEKSGQSSGKRRRGWCVAPLLGDLRRRVAAPGFAQLETANGKREKGLVRAHPQLVDLQTREPCGGQWAPGQQGQAGRGQICDDSRAEGGRDDRRATKDAVARRSWCHRPPYKNAPSVSQITGNNSGLARVQGAGLRSPRW